MVPYAKNRRFVMRRFRYAFALIVLGLTACFAPTPRPPPPPPAQNPQLAVCQAGIVQLRQEWQVQLLSAPAFCVEVPSDATWGGAYLGYAGPNKILLAVGNAPGETQQAFRDALTHEEGHAWDHNQLSDAQRAAFAQVTGHPWNVETYADTFAILVGGLKVGFYGTKPPSPDVRDEICAQGLVPC
jgi:hypothetical protein